MKKFNILTICAAALMIRCTGGGDHPAVIYQTDFESGAEEWAPCDSSCWSVTSEGENHVFELLGECDYEPPVRSPFRIAWLDSVSVSDFVLDLDARLTGGGPHDYQDLCVLFDGQDASHYYYAHISRTADDVHHNIMIVNGSPRASIVLERNEGVAWSEGWHHIRLIRNTESGKILIFYDNMESAIMTANDTTFVSGKIGLGSFDDKGMFDNVRISAIIGHQ